MLLLLRIVFHSLILLSKRHDTFVKWDYWGNAEKRNEADYLICWFLQKLFWQRERVSLQAMPWAVYELTKGAHLGALNDNYMTKFLLYFDLHSPYNSLKSCFTGLCTLNWKLTWTTLICYPIISQKCDWFCWKWNDSTQVLVVALILLSTLEWHFQLVIFLYPEWYYELKKFQYLKTKRK